MSKKIEEMRQLIGYYNVDPNKAHEYTVNGSQDLYNRTYVNSNEVSETNEANTHNFIDPTKEEAPQDFTSKLSDFFNVGETVTDAIDNGIDYVKSTNIWKTYTFNKQDILEEANNIHTVTGIPVNAIIDSPQNLKNAREVMDRVKKQENLRDQDGSYDLGAMIERYPALKNIANKDEAQAAQILYDLKDVKAPQNIVERLQRTQKVIFNNWKMGTASADLGYIGTKGLLGAKETEEDIKRRAQISEEMQKLTIENEDLSTDLIDTILGQTTQQLPRLGVAAISGKMAGGAVNLAAKAYTAGRLALLNKQTPALGTIASSTSFLASFMANFAGNQAKTAAVETAAAIAATAGNVLPMAVEIIGNDYLEYSNLKTKDGKKLLTDNEARAYAIIDGFIETGIEFWSYENLMSAIGGKNREAIKGIVKANAGNKAGIMLSLRGKILNTLKAGIKSGKGEIVEEVTQQIDNDFWNNVVSWTHDNAENKPINLAEMTINSLQAGVQAAPSVFGMSVLGGGLNSVKIARNIAAMENMKRTLGENFVKTVTGVQMLKDLKAQQADNNIFKKNKEQYQETIKGAVQNSEYRETTIDTELAAQDAETMQVLYQVAEEAGISKEEIAAAIENKAEITVPTEIVAAIALPESANNKLMNIVSFEKGGNSLGRIKYEATRLQEASDRLLAKEVERTITVAENKAASMFPEKPGQDKKTNDAYRAIASTIIINNPKNPAEGWKAELNNAQAEIDNRLQPIIDLLKEDYGNGVSLIGLDEQHGNNGNRGEKLKVSNNAAWYSRWYKKYKRQPTKNDLEDIAIEIYKGNGKKYGEKYAKWDLESIMEQASFSGNAEDFAALEAERNAKEAEIDNLFDRREMLRDMKTQMLELNASELALTKGLSPEGLQVYNIVKNILSEATGEGVRKAAKMSAVLWAQHAEVMAKALTEAGHPMTALEYFNNNLGISANATKADEQVNAAAQSQMGKLAEEKLKADEEKWSKTVDNRDSLDVNKLVDVMQTPLVMQLAGVPALPIKMKHGGFDHILKGHEDSMDTNTLKALPRALADPLFIAKSNNHIMIALDLPDKNGVSVVSFFNITKKGADNKSNTLLLTAYGKDSAYGKIDANKKTDYKWYVNNFLSHEERMLYINKNKTAAWLPSPELNMLRRLRPNNDLFDYNIPNENDLVKAQQENPNLYQFAGPKSHTASLELLDSAKAMEQEGKSREDIYKETGWLRGDDTQWRYYIPDNINKINFNSAKVGDKTTLGQIYDNPKLYAAYPYLEDVKIKFIEVQKGYHGWADSSTNTISVAATDSVEQMKSTLVHEVQHFIQDFEGFAQGGNIETAKATVGKSFRILQWQSANIVEDNNIPNNIVSNEMAHRAAEILYKQEKLNNPILIDKEKFIAASSQEIYNKLLLIGEVTYNIDSTMDKLLEQKKYKDENVYYKLAGEVESRRAERIADIEADIENLKERINELKKKGVVVSEKSRELKEQATNALKGTAEESKQLDNIIKKILKISDGTAGLNEKEYAKAKEKIAKLREQYSAITDRQYKKFEELNSKIPKNELIYLNAEGEIEYNTDKLNAAILEKEKGTLAILSPFAVRKLSAATQAADTSAENTTLAAYHNVYSGDIVNALKLGGLPVPSIAIVNKDYAYNDFGDITLIANKDIIDPENNGEVYNRDVWSATFPPVAYKPATSKAEDNFEKLYSDIFKRAGGYMVGMLDTARRSNPARVVDEFVVSNAGKLAYVEKVLHKKVDIPYKNTSARDLDSYFATIEASKDLQLQKDLLAISKNMSDNDEAVKEAGEAIKKAIARITDIDNDKSAEEYIKQSARKFFFDKNGEAYFGPTFRAIDAVRQYEINKNKNEVDKYALQDLLNKAITDYDAYQEWARKELEENLVGDPMVAVGKKLLPFNLENITAAMIKGKTVNAQDFFGFGLGKVVASGAKKLRSLAAIKKEGKKLFTDKQAAIEAAEAVQNSISEYRDTVLSDMGRNGNNEDVTTDIRLEEAVHKALGKAAEKSRITKGQLYNAFAKEFGEDIDISDVVLEEGVELVKNIRDLARTYFEAKPQRAVAISEFSGAVVPKETDTKLIKQLKEKGLQVEVYDKDIPNSRIEAIRKIDKERNVFFQKEKNIQGQIAISQKGKSIISLFATANESTFVHEMGHLALRDLKMVAELENAPAQFVKDWNTIKDFIGWKEDQTDFTVGQQEKFARSFEGYLRKGDAPTRGLQRVFRNFKKWLTNIYTNLKQLGGDISPEVKAVMDRMIATQEQIDDEAALQEIDSFSKIFKSGKVDANTESMHARWIEEAKEVVGEKVLAKAMENVKENWNVERANIIKEEKAAIEQDYANNKIQLAAEAVKLNGGNYELVANALGFNTVEELKQAITDLEKEKEVVFNSFVEALDTGYSADNLKAEAEEMLMTTEYRNMAVGLELEYLSKKASQVNSLDSKIAKQLDSLEKALQEADNTEANTTNPADGKAYIDQEGGKYSALRKQIANLKYAARWTDAENKLLLDIQKAKGKAEALRAVNEFKAAMANRTEQLKVLRDEAVGTVAQYKAYAQRKIAEMSIAQATGTRAFIQQERRKAKEVEKLAIQGKWQEALAAKREQLLFSNLAEQSVKVKENINKQVSRVQKRVLRLGKAATKFPIDNRYMYQHIAYVFGFAKQDAQLPEGVTVSITDLLRKWNNDNSLVIADSEEAGNIGLPTWFTNAIAGTTVYEGKYKTAGYEGLTIDDFYGVIETLNNVYTLGVNENKLLTIKDNDGNSLDLDTAINSLVDSVTENVDPITDYDPTGLGPAGYFEKLSSKAKAGKDFFTNVDRALGGAAKFGLSLIKAETIFDRLDGGKHGFFMSFFYDVINNARTKEVELSVEYGKKLAAIFESNYSQKERTDMYYNREYSFSGQKITKQQLMCIALNCGTELNKKRVLDGFGVSENELNDLLSNLQERDWNTIQAIWNTFNDLWPETVKVELNMNGSNLQKEKAVPFTITNKEGTTFNIEGGYYPIKYNSQVSVTAQTQEADNLAKGQMSGNAIFGVGRGFTKARTKQTVARPILTDFSVISSTLNDVIHNICFREACRDTNRLITNKVLQEKLLQTIGKNSYNVLNSWVKDNWSRENKNGQVDNVIRYARTHLTMSVLGFRTTTAVLNVINFSPMCEYLGGLNALKAVTEFYSSPLANKDFVLNKSVFLQNRSELMDRDFGEVIRNLRKKDTTLSKIQAQSFSIIAATDLMFAMPLFKFEYERVYQEELTKGIPAEKIEQHAVAAGDQAVRRVFGSGDTKDLAGMQKGSELDKALTMYYSYFNVVLNSIARKYYKGKDTGNWTSLARSLIYWLVIPAAAESILRAAMGGEEDWTPEAILKRAVRNFGDQITGTIPVIRDVAKWPLDMIIDGKSFGSKEVSFGALGIVRRANDTIQLVLQMQGANKNKKDWLDVAQSAVKTSNAVTGFSDTFTDSLFTTGRWISNDFENDVSDYIYSLVMDKKLETKGALPKKKKK